MRNLFRHTTQPITSRAYQRLLYLLTNQIAQLGFSLFNWLRLSQVVETSVTNNTPPQIRTRFTQMIFFSNDSKLEWGLTLLLDFHTQLFHQRSTLVLELGPPAQGQRKTRGLKSHPGQSLTLTWNHYFQYATEGQQLTMIFNSGKANQGSETGEKFVIALGFCNKNNGIIVFKSKSDSCCLPLNLLKCGTSSLRSRLRLGLVVRRDGVKVFLFLSQLLSIYRDIFYS